MYLIRDTEEEDAVNIFINPLITKIVNKGRICKVVLDLSQYVTVKLVAPTDSYQLC